MIDLTARTLVGTLQVATCLYEFVESEALPGSGVEPARFWQGFEEILTDLTPANRALLAERDGLQSQIDAWHRNHPSDSGSAANLDAYQRRSTTTSSRFSATSSGGSTRAVRRPCCVCTVAPTAETYCVAAC